MEELVVLPRLSRVAVCGGTHGNELSGVYLVRELLRRGRKEEEEEEVKKKKEEEVEVVTVLSNPRAVQLGRRYLDTDLNRCFTLAALSAPLSDDPPYEMVRSRELNAMLGPKGGAGAADLVCDLHNTTCNMGLCFIACSLRDWLGPHIFAHLQRSMPDVPMRFVLLSCQESYSLDSVGKHGFAMEIGPQPHGVVRADVFSAMKTGVQRMLEWVRLFNSGSLFEGGFLEVFTTVQKIDYPRDEETHDITAAVHPQLQDRDFCLLRPGDPLFQTFSGETLPYGGKEPLYPFFINECAYYEKGVALYLARKRRVRLPAVRAQTDEERRAREEDLTSEEEE